MRLLPSMANVWRSGVYIGATRPIGRVTVQHNQMRLHRFHLKSTYTERAIPATGIGTTTPAPSYDIKKGRPVSQTYANFLFNAPADPKELPSVRSISWSRSKDTDVATCTITLTNSEVLEENQVPIAGEIDQLGYYTPTRGQTVYSARWGHAINEWSNLLLPDNIIRTYEGYGTDGPEVAPEHDTKLALTGVWLIDRVEMNARGEMELHCRDLGRILLEQFAYNPVVPKDFYPLSFENWDGKVHIGNRNPDKSLLRVRIDDTSNTPWIGTGTVAGHKPAHAIDGRPNTYWLSIGNDRPSRSYAYEWVQVSLAGKSKVSEVRFRSIKKGYTAYVSVYANGAWQGVRTIAYNEAGIGQNGADIKYVATKKVTSEATQTIRFTPIAGATKVRLTFGNLQYFQNGPYHYRAGIREIAVYGITGRPTPNWAALTPGPAGSNPGRYSDYVDIVKLYCAWAGFFWPKGSHFRASDGSTISATFSKSDDKVLGHGVNGRIWGDFQDSGTSGPTPIQSDVWDKKSLMDGIKYVRDILGYHFAIDESGGVQFRLPNIYDLGNWITLSTSAGRTSTMYTLDETLVLTDFRAILDSQNVREKILVSDNVGNIASTAKGYNPNPTGLRRLSIFTNQNFESKTETKVMAQLIAIRQMFEYRTARSQIVGFPGIQVDDQVRVKERTTEEGYVHYVRSINSQLDMVAGTYTMDIESNWLGIDPSSKWLVKRGLLTQDAQDYLEGLLEVTPDLRKLAA